MSDGTTFTTGTHLGGVAGGAVVARGVGAAGARALGGARARVPVARRGGGAASLLPSERGSMCQSVVRWRGGEVSRGSG